MNQQKRSLTGILAMVFVFSIVTQACAFPPEDGPKGSKDWDKKMEARMKKVHRELGLTEEQEKKLKSHRKEHRRAAKELRETKKEKRKALKAELQKPDFDRKKVQAIHEDVKKIILELADHRLEGILEVREILTTEQFVKFHELMKKHKGKRRGKKKGRRHHSED